MKKSLVKTRARVFVIAQLSVVVIVCCTQGRAQAQTTTQIQTPTQTSALASAAGSGVINGNVYQNSYFGLRLTIPASWSVEGEAVKQQILERGKTAIIAKSEQDKAQLAAAADRTINLLTLSKVPIGTPNQFNAIFMSLAEPVPLGATAPGYIGQLKAVLKQAQMPVNFLDEQVETINGVQFHTLTTTLGRPENLVRQKYYVLLKKGYALALITTILSDSDSDTMNGILRSVTVQ